MAKPTAVLLEIGSAKVFASALDWPGWCRAGKTEEAALDALGAYAERFAEVAGQAGLRFPAGAGESFTVVERVPGNATTDFGAPGAVGEADTEKVTLAQAKRAVALVEAAWAVFDRIVADTPPELRKGPRGGGRDRDKMIDHVLGAEAAYARKLGVKHRQPAIGDAAAIAALRADLVTVLGKASDGSAPVDRGWPPRYAARRIAWHVLDHAWEMRDRTL